jgi:uncharacterized protein
MVNDCHVHFFSPSFLDALGAQKGLPADGRAHAVAHALKWEEPASIEALANRWTAELTRHGVARAALIASVPGDEESVAAALAQHPSRFVGFFMLDPTKADAVERATAALDRGLRGICLFPAMHHYPLYGEHVLRIFDLAKARPGTAVFAHCGALSVGVRKRLGLPSPFEMRYGNPLDLQQAAHTHPTVPIILPPLDILGPDRLLFGTDSSFFPRGWVREIYDRQRAALGSAAATGAVREKVLGGNFDRLFPQARPQAAG